ncbi:MAG: hypothetical protein R3C44_15985 [Chloroflexota bacterium]
MASKPDRAPGPLRQARLHVPAALALGLGLGATTGLVTGQFIELGIQTASGEFLVGFNLLPPFPPLSILRRLGNRLGSGFSLGDISLLAGPFFI